MLVLTALGGLLNSSATAWAQTSPARAFDKMQLVEIGNGPNTVDIEGNGQDGLVFQAHRENYNAHSFEHTTFYRREKSDPPANVSTPSAKSTWDLVPFFSPGDGGKEMDAFDTVQGADCRLRDLVVLRPHSAKHSPLIVIVAERDFGETYVDEKQVTFSVYKIKRNDDSSPGEPAVYFQRVDQFRSKKSYCDADDAIRSELKVKLPKSPDGE